MRLTQMAVATGLMFVVLVAQACDLKPVPIVQSIGKAGDVTVNFGEADDVQHPSACEGPLQISVGDAPVCSVSEDVSIVEQPVMYGSGVLYVPTYSGSNNRLYAVDVKTCKVIWRSDNFDAKPVFKKGKVVMGVKEVSIDKRCRPFVSQNK